VVALAVGAVQRGGYNTTSRVAMLVLAAGGLAVSLVGRNRPAAPVLGALLVGAVLLVGSAVLSATVADDPAGALEPAGLVLLFVAGVAAAAATPVVARPLLVDALLVVAAVVGGSAWVGVVWRVFPMGYPVEGLWRGGSTLTYANAAAALLAMVLVLSVVRIAADGPARWTVVLATYVAGVGLVATLNRAGIIAVVVGLLVAAVAARPVPLGRVVLRLALAVGVASAGVFAGVSTDRPAQPALAVVLLLAGAAVAVGADRRWSVRTTRVLLAAAAFVVVVGVVVAAPGLIDGTSRLGEARLSVGGDDRAGAWGAAVDEIVSSPFVGKGPSTTSFVWTDGSRAWRIQYVHNEPLELLATQGLVGAAAALVAALALARTARGVALGTLAWLRPAVLGALAAFLVHSTFDFDLHIPVLVVAAGMMSGLVLPSSATFPEQGAEAGSAE
jgi:hypothetical protein